MPQYILWVSFGFFFLFVGTSIAYVRAEKAVDRANDARFNSYLVADELRQSSEDLTRMVRSYIATGNPIFKEHYREILDIREGRKPRPLDATNVYWDLVMDDDVRPRAPGPAVPMLELMRRAGFAPSEFAALADAKAASDALTKTEYAAMVLLESSDRPTDAARVQAVQRLYDSNYRQAKARIMEPIARFQAASVQRTRDAVAAAQSDAHRIRWYAILLGAGLVLSLSRLFLAIKAQDREKVENYTLFRAMFDKAGVGLAQVSTIGRFQQVNQEFCQIVGYTSRQLRTADVTIDQLMLPDERSSYYDNLQHLLRGAKDEFALTSRCVHQSGRIVWLNVFVYLLRNSAGHPASLVVAAVDVTEGKAAEVELENYREHLEQLVEERTLDLEAGNDRLKREIAARERAVEELQKSEGRFRFLAENSADVIWTSDLATDRFTYVSPSVEALRGYTVAEVLDQPASAALTPDSLARVRDAIAVARTRWNDGAHTDCSQTLEVDQPHKDGHVVHTEVAITLHADGTGSLKNVLGISRDITKRKESERVIRQLAFHDGLTKLPNRRLLQDRLNQAILRARRDGSKLAVLFLDLDGFKPVNDTFGHSVGDWLLCSVAERMHSCLRDSDTAARIGGDEFVVVLPDLAHPDHAMVVGERIRAAIEKPFVTTEGQSLEVTSSVGVVLYPDHAETAGELLRLGDEAMYQAKNLGRNRVTMLCASTYPFNSANMPISAGSALIHLSWRPAYACGDATIDAEHRELFGMANRLFEVAVRDEQPPQSIFKRLDRLLVSIKAHFYHEEGRLRECGYPQLREHADLHRTLLTHANSLRQKAEANDITIGQLIDFVAIEVVARHLLEADREFFPFVGSRQSSVPATGS